jgi:hypothetical protein
MTWTPGLVLDCARALHHVVDPRRVGRLARLMGIVRRARGTARAAKAAVGKIPA